MCGLGSKSRTELEERRGKRGREGEEEKKRKREKCQSKERSEGMKVAEDEGWVARLQWNMILEQRLGKGGGGREGKEEGRKKERGGREEGKEGRKYGRRECKMGYKCNNRLQYLPANQNKSCRGKAMFSFFFTSFLNTAVSANSAPTRSNRRCLRIIQICESLKAFPLS